MVRRKYQPDSPEISRLQVKLYGIEQASGRVKQLLTKCRRSLTVAKRRTTKTIDKLDEMIAGLQAQTRH